MAFGPDQAGIAGVMPGGQADFVVIYRGIDKHVPFVDRARSRSAGYDMNIIPLMLVMLLAVVGLSGFVFHQFSRSQADVEQVQRDIEKYSRKMHINSELMELARARTRLTSAIIDSPDPFEQDELNQTLENHAGRFAGLRAELMKLPLDAKEKAELDTHRQIVSVILPSQRKAVELAQRQTDDARAAAKALLYKGVFPGQGQVIDSFGRLITHEQSRISALAATSKQQLDLMRNRVRDALFIGLLAFVVLTMIVAARVQRIQLRLQRSHKALEESNITLEKRVSERTQELNRLNEALRHASEHDELTKIYNRRKFDQIIEQQHATAMRTGVPYALALIDIDYFKHYNDNYGHQQGDHCLATVAGALAAALPRSTDAVCRYGGEEFAVVLPATHLEGAVKVAERLRQVATDLQIPHAHSAAAACVTISVGLAAYQSESDPSLSTVADVIKAADGQLYKAKARGRNRVAFGVEA